MVYQKVKNEKPVITGYIWEITLTIMGRVILTKSHILFPSLTQT